MLEIVREKHLLQSNASKDGREIDGFISELLLSTNMVNFNQEFDKLDPAVTFTDNTFTLKFENRIHSKFEFEIPHTAPQCKGRFLESHILFPPTEFEKTMEKDETNELDISNLDAIFEDQKLKEKEFNMKRQIKPKVEPKVDHEGIWRDCQSFEIKQSLGLLSSKNRKKLHRLSMLHNRSYLQGEYTKSDSIKEVAINCLYMNSNGFLDDPESISDELKVI